MRTDHRLTRTQSKVVCLLQTKRLVTENSSIESIVLQVIEQASMKSICAGFEGKGYNAIEEAMLCSLIIVDELELADGIDRWMAEIDAS